MVKTVSSGGERRSELLLPRDHHGIVGRRQSVKVEGRLFLLPLRFRIADGRARDGDVALRKVHVGGCGAFGGLCRLGGLDRRDVGLRQFLPAFADAFGIGVVGLGLFEAGRRPLQIGLGLLDRRLGAREPRALLARIEPREHRAFRDAIADIGRKIDEDAGNLEADLRLNARLDGAEPEDLNRHVTLDPGHLNLDRP